MKSFITVVCTISVFAASAQWHMPENGQVFTHDEIPKVHLTIDPDSLADLYLPENWYSNKEYLANMVFETNQLSDTLVQVGIRFRGNTSRDKIKKSFKISFNTYVPDRSYHGLEKLNLNAETNDPSMLRSRLTWDLFRAMNVPASRSNHVELYINNEYYGLYQNIEQIDEEFADLRFGSKQGNLYKCSYPANLNYISNIPDDYKIAPWGTRTYELKTNEDQDDYSDLAEFIVFLNQANNADLACGLATYFDVYQYLKVVAVDVLTGNWDGYIYNQNNFYLYHNPITDQFEYIPYDLDNTWGIDWVNQDWASRNIYLWSQAGEPRPLYTRLLNIQAFRDIFSWHINELLNSNYGTSAHFDQMESLHDFITASALADPYRPLDFDFSGEDFLESLDIAAGGHVEYGNIPFANSRRQYATSQLNLNTIAPIIHRVIEDFDDFPNSINVQVFLSGPEVTNCQMSYSINNGGNQILDGTELDNLYEFTIPLPLNSNSITYQLTATGQNGLVRNAYCTARNLSFVSNDAEVLLNEVMTSNQNSVSDEAGEMEDWIELFQNSTTPINLNTYYLTDDPAAPTKWKMPEQVINPGVFSIIWADEDLGQGPLHANFKLSASGEHLFLFQRISNGLRLVDHIDIPTLPSNYSYGRINDATLPWVLFDEPTPFASNGGVSSINNGVRNTLIQPYPNPSFDRIKFGSIANYSLYNLQGSLQKSGFGSEIVVSDLAAGLYFLHLPKGIYKVQVL